MRMAEEERIARLALYVFFFIDHGRRDIVHLNVTSHPTARWM